MLVRIALALKDEQMRKDLKHYLHKADVLFHILGADSSLDLLVKEPCDIFIMSENFLSLPLEQVALVVSKIPEPPVLVFLTQYEDEERRALLLASGCDTVLHEGLPKNRLFAALESIVKKRAGMQATMLQGRRQLGEPRLSDFVSHSRPMQAFMNIAHRVVRSDSSLLILGETGVGKERLALAVHAEGNRADAPFIPINCAALPDNLLESELFGHEQGAFTGATRTRRGAFELAHRGTIFLDEVGDMPLLLQAKLLRVLQDRQFVKLGGEKPIKVDVRVMAATNRDLSADIEKGTFRRDLYYRLSVVTLTIPPLRARSEDIPELINSYIGYLCPRIGVETKALNSEVIEALSRYKWPGNVRELINVLERAILLCEGKCITVNELPDEIARGRKAAGAPDLVPEFGANMSAALLQRTWTEVRAEALESAERWYLDALLRHNRGRIDFSAQQAGMSTRAFYAKMRRYNLDKSTYKNKLTESSL